MALNRKRNISGITLHFPNQGCCAFLLRDLKDPVVTRVRLESPAREDRRDTGASLVCRVCPDLQ